MSKRRIVRKHNLSREEAMKLAFRLMYDLPSIFERAYNESPLWQKILLGISAIVSRPWVLLERCTECNCWRLRCRKFHITSFRWTKVDESSVLTSFLAVWYTILVVNLIRRNHDDSSKTEEAAE